jgi:glycosyltransferase involved in cell wall biosynthesis
MRSGGGTAGAQLTRLAVDLTPLRPGGVNGGAKTVALELLRGFRGRAPGLRLLLLTAEHNHEELGEFEGPLTERRCVLPTPMAPAPPRRARPAQRIRQLANRLPGRVRESVKRRVPPWLRRTIEDWGPPAGASRFQPLQGLGVDLLFCPFSAPTFAEPGIPTVAVVYDLQHTHYPQFFAPEELVLRQARSGDLRRRADLVVCISEHTRAEVVSRMGIPAARTRTIPVNLHSRLHPPRVDETIRNLDGLGLRRPYLLFPANFWPHKNHRLLMVAYGMLVSRNRSLALDLVLTGALEAPEAELREAVAGMGLGPRVHFLGYVPDRVFPSVLAGCEALVYPSLHEGYGIPLLEAMAFGKPVACSAVASLPEVAGGAAVLFDPRRPASIVEALERILGDPGLRSRLREDGRRRAAELAGLDMAQAYLDEFGELLRQPGRTRAWA